ncbi:MAG: FAD-dependent oxidoreductase [Aeromicrobium sp.]|uniref:FAD-dependent oxidoreductase n=1 Tax=Aeromicrobium sp. TaxID=1871063 RepID=UPI0039E56390
MSEHYDVVVIGSGFGGSVSALRLTEKGYRVAVLESHPAVPEGVSGALRLPVVGVTHRQKREDS